MKLVLVVLRGCSAGWLGAYGNEVVATPNLDRLAARGVVFDAHYVATAAPSAAVVSDDWSETLRRHGTALIGVVLGDDQQRQKCYAAWDKVFTANANSSHPEAVFASLSDRSDWLVAVDCPWLLPPWTVTPDEFERFCRPYFIDPNDDGGYPEPVSAPPFGPVSADDHETLDVLQASFAAVVTAADDRLNAWFRAAEAAGASIVVTSESGTPLGEHGVVGVAGSLPYEELAHLPLIFAPAVAGFEPLRVPELTHAGQLEALIDRYADVRATAAVVTRGHGRSVRTAEWTLIVPPEGPPKLFTRPDDRWEQNDVASRHPEVVEAMLAEFGADFGGEAVTPPRQ